MSNETKNRSHAGLVLRTFGDPQVDPVLMASWGIDEATLTREVGIDVGVYSIRLSNPASGLVGPTINELSSIDSVVLQSGIVQAPALFANVALLPEAGAVPVVGQSLQLPLVVLSLVDETGTAQDADAIVQVEVRAVPQQD